MRSAVTPNSGPFLTTTEACELLKISDRTLRTLTQAGTIPHVRLAPRTIRYRRDVLLAFGAEDRDSSKSQ
jgi:excisionase family DNA binding protein